VSPRNLGSLDALRGIAILLVLVSHFYPGGFAYPEAIGLSCANCGVILFFFLSGFLMDRNLAVDSSVFPYLVRRSFRILPLYWLSLIFVLLFDAKWTAGDFLSNATFTTPITESERMLGVYWTLYIEVLFYALVPFIRRLGEPAIRAVPYAAIVIFGLVWLVRGNINAALFYLLFCFAGMQFGSWYRGQLSTAALSIAMITVGVSSSAFPIVSVYFGLAPLACALAMWFALKLEWRFTPLELLGHVSYSLYLLHAIFGYPIVAWCRLAGVAPWLTASAGVAVSVVAAVVTFRLVERPAINLGKFIITRHHSILRTAFRNADPTRKVLPEQA
jgi:peptidoglycan/LPS O-acetylase OafA/YrhL